MSVNFPVRVYGNAGRKEHIQVQNYTVIRTLRKTVAGGLLDNEPRPVIHLAVIERDRLLTTVHPLLADLNKKRKIISNAEQREERFLFFLELSRTLTRPVRLTCILYV